MKFGHLERYKVTLNVLSPTYIGAGTQDTLSQKECAFDTKYGVVYVPNLQRLVETVDKRGCMNEFETFLERNVEQHGVQTLYQFLQSMCIPINKNAEWVQYVLRVGSSEINRVNTLNRFVKNTEGLPYIPGSSIKGAIRTALLAEMTSQSTLKGMLDTMKKDAETNSIMRNRRPGAEEYALHTLHFDPKRTMDAVNDLMRTIEISDSAPFTGESLMVCKKLEFDSDGHVRGNAEGNRRGKTSPPLYRECLIPGQRTHFYITIDHRLTDKPLTIQSVKRALSGWSSIQDEYVNQFYVDEIKYDHTRSSGTPLILGGGVGFQSKSLAYKYTDTEEVRNVVEAVLSSQFRRNYKPKYTNDPQPYRLKIVTYNGVFYQMGRCDMIIEEK